MADPMADGNSLEGRATAGEDDAQAELFPAGVADGDGIHPRKRIKASHEVQCTLALGSKEVPLRNGLPDPDHRVRYIVEGLPGKAEDVPMREDKNDPDKVTGYKTRQHVRVLEVRSVPSTDREMVIHLFRAMLDDVPSAAGSLLDVLRKMSAEALTAA